MEVQRGGGVGNMVCYPQCYAIAAFASQLRCVQQVSRRYSEFVKLHRLLLSSHPAQYVKGSCSQCAKL
jgi:hypothetical protein